MRRNKEWALQLLVTIEEGDSGGAGLFRSELRQLFADDVPTPGMSPDDVWDAVDYHLHLLETAGFVKCDSEAENGSDDNFELTWQGHDYLDSVR